MKKRFILATNITTSAEDQLFKDKLTAAFPGVAWWHRLNEVWLISDPQGRLEAKTLRDLAKECYIGKRLLAFEINNDGDTWSAISDAGGSAKETFAWLHKNWKKE